MDVRDIMSRNPLSIEPDAPVAAAIDVMVEHKIRHLPVVDERGTVVGIITDRDLRSAVLAPALEEYLTDRDAVKTLARQVPALRPLMADAS